LFFFFFFYFFFTFMSNFLGGYSFSETLTSSLSTPRSPGRWCSGTCSKSTTWLCTSLWEVKRQPGSLPSDWSRFYDTMMSCLLDNDVCMLGVKQGCHWFVPTIHQTRATLFLVIYQLKLNFWPRVSVFPRQKNDC